jgi:hypothetical protein
MRRLLVMSIAFVSFQFVGPVCALEQFNTQRRRLSSTLRPTRLCR